MNNKKEGFKEVWHVWDGNIENREVSFVKYVKGIRFGDGAILYEENILPYRDTSKAYILWAYWGKLDNTIIAYTTGQMRRRVDCDLCKNTGLFCYEGMGCVVCQNCNGQGYKWEYKNNG